MYVISDYENPKSPVIIHFILVNDTFRQYSSPDVPRAQGRVLYLGISVVCKNIFQAMSEEISKFSKIQFILHLILPMIRNEDSPDGCYDDGLSSYWPSVEP